MHILLWYGIFVVVFLTTYSVWRAWSEYRGLAELYSTTASAHALHLMLTAYAAWTSMWTLPIVPVAAMAVGVVFLMVGRSLFETGIYHFGSIKRKSGMGIDRLVTSGSYRWSRNPQNFGWGLFHWGVVILGRSAVGLLLASLFPLNFRLNLPDEDRHLRGLYDDEYRQYCEHTRCTSVYFTQNTRNINTPIGS